MVCRAVALHVFFRNSTIGKTLATHQAPTGILTDPLEDSNGKSIHPAVVLIKLSDKAQ
jgi:hypothetical protein